MTGLLIQYWPAATFAPDIYGLKWFISGEWRFGFKLNGIRDEEDGSGWSCEGVAVRWQNHPVPRGRMLLYISHQIVKWSICSAPPSQVCRCPCLSYWVDDWTSPYKVVESLSRCKSCVPCLSLHPLRLHPASCVSSQAVITAIRFHSSHKVVPYLKLFHLNSGHESFFPQYLNFEQEGCLWEQCYQNENCRDFLYVSFKIWPDSICWTTA